MGRVDAAKDDRDPWDAEADAITLDERDFAVADAADLPALRHRDAAAAPDDEQFVADFAEWLEALMHDPRVLLALEQSCTDGVRLPWDMRGVRLASVADQVLDVLHRYWDHCPRHVSAHLDNYVFWLVRAERARRRGSPEWSPRSTLPPAIEDSAYFRPPVLLVRRYSG